MSADFIVNMYESFVFVSATCFFLGLVMKVLAAFIYPNYALKYYLHDTITKFTFWSFIALLFFSFIGWLFK